MPLPALQRFERKIERQIRLLEISKTIIERKIDRQIRLFEQKRDSIGKKIESQIRLFERKRGIRLDDEVRFIRSWMERPLSIGAVTPSGKVLARAMARYVDPNSNGPVVELGPGTGPVTEASAVVSGLPLVTKPIRERWRLVRDAFDLMVPGAPFVQFTYSVASPLPKRLGGFTAEASERIWMNIPPARVWVYRKS